MSSGDRAKAAGSSVKQSSAGVPELTDAVVMFTGHRCALSGLPESQASFCEHIPVYCPCKFGCWQYCGGKTDGSAKDQTKMVDLAELEIASTAGWRMRRSTEIA
jgi:hypothetical protein